MKRFTIMAVVAMLSLGIFCSCDKSNKLGGSKSSLKNEVDTFSYAMGMAQTQGLKAYLTQMGVDTTYINEFIKGMKDGVNAGDNKKKNAYYMGIQIGQQISNRMVKGLNYELFGDDSTKTISVKNFLAGFEDGVRNRYAVMDFQNASTTAQEKMQSIKAKQMEKKYGDVKAEGEKWLAANAKKEGVKVLPSGVQYKVIKEGSGPMPADTSLVKVHYEGRLIDGTVFDSSYKRGEPATMRANQVIKGWTEALVHMPEGSIWEVYIPQELAYGEREAGQIKPFSALVFKIELISAKSSYSTKK